MDSKSVNGSINMGDDTSIDPLCFSRVVDIVIMSSTCSSFGESRVPSFASLVDCAIRSDSASIFEISSHIDSFALAEDKSMRSKSEASFLGKSSLAEAMMTTIAAQISQVALDAKGHVAALLFTRAEIEAATNNFSLENKIGAGSFGVVYRGKLYDGRKVAIKSGEIWSGYKYELDILSRLHHKNLVGLVGYCKEYLVTKVSVHEYMKNGTLSKHLHEQGSRDLNDWRMRINIALDVSRGIEYIHNCAIPCIIHRHIKSSNILLDANWTAKVSNFGLSFRNPERPEYYFQNTYSKKSNVYELGVVLLELLTGKRATKYGEDGELVNFAVPFIYGGELVKILDPKVGAPDVNEAQALELVALTAFQCVNFKLKQKPTVSDIVVNLDRALAMCDTSPSTAYSPKVDKLKIILPPPKVFYSSCVIAKTLRFTFDTWVLVLYPLRIPSVVEFYQLKEENRVLASKLKKLCAHLKINLDDL